MSYFVPLSRACVYAALIAPTDTTITEANTYQYVNGIFSNTPMVDFEFVSDPTPAIKYIGTKEAYFDIIGTWVHSVNAPNTTVRVAIKKNNDVLTDSIISMLCIRANEPFSNGGDVVTFLQPNDLIQIVVATDGTGDVVTFSNLCANIKQYIR